MKKFGLLAAALLCFAGCAQNDTEEMGAAESTDSTAVGTAASGQSGSIDSSMQDTNSLANTNSLSITNDQSSTLSSDTNSLGQPASPQSGSELSSPPPQPPSQPQGSQPTP